MDKTVFDEKQMLARLSDDKVLARQVVAGFLRDVPERLRKLGQHIEAGDVRTLRSPAGPRSK